MRIGGIALALVALLTTTAKSIVRPPTLKTTYPGPITKAQSIPVPPTSS